MEAVVQSYQGLFPSNWVGNFSKYLCEKHSVLHHSYADDSQLQKSAEPSEVPQLLEAMQDCIADVRAWMTTNKLKLNNNKTEVMLLSTPQMLHKITCPSTMTVGDATVTFSSSVVNLGVTLDHHLEMKDQLEM